MNNKKLDQLKDNYNNIEIPENLNHLVNQSLNKKKTINKKWLTSAASVAVLVGGINLSPAFANTLEQIPVVGNIVKVIRLSNYNLNENGFDVSIDVSKVEGLKNKELQANINKEMEDNAKKLYQEYVKEIEELKKDNIPGREMVKSWSETMTNNDKILSLVVYEFHAQGSSNTTRKFYNINKQNETALTLENMFAGKDYINIISENIKEQMKQQMKENPDKAYWLDDKEIGDGNFDKIRKDQGFYINDKNELVICFDKYEVAPGYMGLVEFTIPNNVLAPNLG